MGIHSSVLSFRAAPLRAPRLRGPGWAGVDSILYTKVLNLA